MSRATRGLTLIELVLGMVVFLAALYAVWAIYITGVKTFTQETSRFDLFWDGNRGMETITEEIRECKDVTVAGSSEIALWWKDLNADLSMEADEIVKYSVSDRILTRTLGSAPNPLLKNVLGFNLIYNNPADPSLVTVTLTLGKEGNLVTLESKANIRNK